MAIRASHTLDLLALTIAAIALAASIRSCTLSNESNKIAQQANDLSKENVQVSREGLTTVVKYNEIAITPLLDFRYKFSIGSRPGDGGSLTLVNLGSGPAKITSIRASFDGNPLSTDARSLALLGNPYGFRASNLYIGQAIASGDSLAIFAIPPRTYPAHEVCPKDRERKSFFEKLMIDVEYESLTHSRQTAHFRYSSPNYLDC